MGSLCGNDARWRHSEARHFLPTFDGESVSVATGLDGDIRGYGGPPRRERGGPSYVTGVRDTMIESDARARFLGSTSLRYAGLLRNSYCRFNG
jgi:hypothetical protein